MGGVGWSFVWFPSCDELVNCCSLRVIRGLDFAVTNHHGGKGPSVDSAFVLVSILESMSAFPFSIFRFMFIILYTGGWIVEIALDFLSA